MDDFDKLVEGLDDISINAQKGHIEQWLGHIIEIAEMGVKSSLKLIAMEEDARESLALEALVRSQSLNRDLAYSLLGVLNDKEADYSPYDIETMLEIAKG